MAGAERHAFVSMSPLSAGLEAPKLPLSRPLAPQRTQAQQAEVVVYSVLAASVSPPLSLL